MDRYGKKIQWRSPAEEKREQKNNNKKPLSCNKSLWSAVHCHTEEHAVTAVSLCAVSWLLHSRTHACIPNLLKEEVKVYSAAIYKKYDSTNLHCIKPRNWFKRISTLETFRNKILSIPFLQRSLTAHPLYPYPWSLITPKPETINLIHHACKKMKPLSYSSFGSWEATKSTTNVWFYPAQIRWIITNEENFLELLSSVCISHPDEGNTKKAFTQKGLNFYRWEDSLAHTWPTSIQAKRVGKIQERYEGQCQMSADFNQDKDILIYPSSVIDKDGAELHFMYHFCLSPQDTLASLYWHFMSLSNFCIWKLIKCCPQWQPWELVFYKSFWGHNLMSYGTKKNEQEY